MIYSNKSEYFEIILIIKGDLFNSYLAATKFMENSEDFAEEDIAKVGLLVEENAKMSRVRDIKVGSRMMIIFNFKLSKSLDLPFPDYLDSRQNVRIQC